MFESSRPISSEAKCVLRVDGSGFSSAFCRSCSEAAQLLSSPASGLRLVSPALLAVDEDTSRQPIDSLGSDDSDDASAYSLPRDVAASATGCVGLPRQCSALWVIGMAITPSSSFPVGFPVTGEGLEGVSYLAASSSPASGTSPRSAGKGEAHRLTPRGAWSRSSTLSSRASRCDATRAHNSSRRRSRGRGASCQRVALLFSDRQE